MRKLLQLQKFTAAAHHARKSMSPQQPAGPAMKDATFKCSGLARCHKKNRVQERTHRCQRYNDISQVAIDGPQRATTGFVNPT